MGEGGGDRGWIARYAWGEDYHEVLEKKLKGLREKIEDKIQNASFKFYVDTGPVMERVFAKNSGIGWIGKNTCVINKKIGSWIFLGAILTNLKLKPDQPAIDHCGSCTACLDACPTQALTQPYQLDARKCISYLTIEHRGEIPKNLSEKMGNHIFGCDICQNVCPWNRKSPKTEELAFQPREDFFNPHLEKFFDRVVKEYPKGFQRSPLKRAKREGLLRNIAIAMGNSKNESYIKKLQGLLNSSPVQVQQAAQTGLKNDKETL